MSNPTLYIIAGTNGVGKTTATFDFTPSQIPVINSDEIARQLKIAGKASNINFQEIGNGEALRLTNEYLNQRITFGIETNLADVETWKFLIEVQRIGYLLHLIFICTDDLKLLNQRIKERTLRGKHFIRPDIVRERHVNGLNLLSYYLFIPEEIQFFDTSIQNKLIAHMQNRKLTVRADVLPDWFQQYILPKTNETSGNEKAAQHLESTEAVRLLYQKIKKDI